MHSSAKCFTGKSGIGVKSHLERKKEVKSSVHTPDTCWAHDLSPTTSAFLPRSRCFCVSAASDQQIKITISIETMLSFLLRVTIFFLNQVGGNKKPKIESPVSLLPETVDKHMKVQRNVHVVTTEPQSDYLGRLSNAWMTPEGVTWLVGNCANFTDESSADLCVCVLYHKCVSSVLLVEVALWDHSEFNISVTSSSYSHSGLPAPSCCQSLWVSAAAFIHVDLNARLPVGAIMVALRPVPFSPGRESVADLC